MDSKIFDVLTKKAFGFTYTEVTSEFEKTFTKPLVFCEKRNRLYFKNSFFSVKKAGTGVQIKKWTFKNVWNLKDSKKKSKKSCHYFLKMGDL